MKRIICVAFACSLIFASSCKRDKKDVPEGYIEYQGELLKETEPLRYDSNGDGVIDEKDKTIEILGTNLNISQAPDGKPLYSGSEGGGSASQSGSQVPVGEKLCYHDLEKYCKKNGGFYAFETTINTAQSEIKTGYTDVDANQNGVPDYIEDIRSTAKVEAIAAKYSSKYAKETEQLIENALTSGQIGAVFISNCLKEAIINALNEGLYESSESVDITSVETILKTRVISAITDAVNEVGLYETIDKQKLVELSDKISDKISKEAADEIASSVSASMLAQYESQLSSGQIQNVRGICPSGYHIPSDVEWMIFEQALGMSAADLTKSGETEISRGADVNIVKKMVSDFGFGFGGYASINGTYAQLGEAGVYWSSTTGSDMKGDYVWVRQIDTSYSGVVRFKMYEKSGLSVRCFKD